MAEKKTVSKEDAARKAVADAEKELEDAKEKHIEAGNKLEEARITLLELNQ